MAEPSFRSALPDLPRLAKEFFVADMHFHTRYSHDCGTRVKEIVPAARKAAIHVALTDHNAVGALRAARRFREAPVIPGIELCSKEGKELLAYFYDAGQLEEFHRRRIAPRLKEKNPMRSSRTPFSMGELLDLLEGEECLLSIPHPFAPQPRRSYPFLTTRLRSHLTGRFQAVEAFNANVTRKGNLAAAGWALELGAGLTGGSDGHLLKWLGRGVTITSATDVEGHLRAIANGRSRVAGLELPSHQRVFNYAQTTVQHKVRKGVRGGVEKGLRLPGRLFQR